MAQKHIKRIIRVILSVLFLLLAVIAFAHRGHINTVSALNLTCIFILILLVRMLNILPFDLLSYISLFSVMVAEFFYKGWIPTSFFILFFLFDISVIHLLQEGIGKTYWVEICITVIAADILLICYDYITDLLLPFYYDFARSLSVLQKAFIILFTGILLLLFFIVTTKFIGKLLNKKCDIFKLFSDKFRDLELYAFIVVAVTLIFSSLLKLSTYLPYRITVLFQIFIILIDSSFIALLFKAVSIKEKMNIVENDKNMISAYNDELESVIGDMKDVRHDIKNLFLTMADFIDGSGDEQIQSFYHKNILPFFKDSVAKSEMFDKLRYIEDDRIKSFFYYKISEKIESGIKLNLEVRSKLSLKEGFGDIIRVLGILIDNAAEEAIVTTEKLVTIKISEEREGISIRIGNTVRDITRERGVIQGTTEKGLGRGNGLIIANKIILKYNNLILNSYFTDKEFVQVLIIINI